MRALTRYAVVATAVAACLSPRASARGAEPFTHGFIRTNVDCNTGQRPRRVRLLSQIFQYCALEVPRSQIVRDNELFSRQVARTACGGDFDISYESVVFDQSESTITQDYRDAHRESGYDKVQEWHASVEYYSSKCR